MPDNYAGVFDGHLPFGRRPALVVVDVVMAYLISGSPLYDPAFAVALAANERIVAAARTGRVPVIFTNVVYQPGGADGGLFYRKVLALKAFDPARRSQAPPFRRHCGRATTKRSCPSNMPRPSLERRSHRR